MLLPALAGLASLTCGGDTLVLPEEGRPALMTVMQGNDQEGTVGVVLPDTLIVRVTDGKDRPVVDARVLFVPGNGANGADLIPDTALTDADGRARARWVLGPTAGTQSAVARVAGFSSVTQTFTATAEPDVADTIFAIKGDSQSAVAGARLADSLVVRVTDRFGNSVSGIPVAWTTSGGGSVSPISGTTGANGQTATSRTLGSSAGPQTAAATAAGLKGSPVIFSHTATAGGAADLLKISGDNGTTAAGGVLAESLVVRLVDASNNGVAGRSVTFTPTPNSGSASPTSATTDAQGFASTQWTLGPAAGTQSLIASSAGISRTFTATATSDVPTQMSIAGGNNQTAAVGTPVATPPSVRVRDANNNTVPNVAVTFTVTGGGGTVSTPTQSGNSVTVATGANGVATLTAWTLGSTVGPNILSASANGPGGPLTGSPLTFNATAIAGSATQLSIETQPPATANSGAALSVSPVVQLRDASGNPVSQAGVNLSVSLPAGSPGSLGGTTTRATNGSGQVTFTGLSISGPTGFYTLVFSGSGITPITSTQITLSAGAATKLDLATHPASNASSGVVLSPQPVVQVTDAAGNPVSLAGVNVTAALTGATGTLGGTTTIATNASGTAAFNDLAITGPSGVYSLRFTSTNPVLTQVTSGNITIGAGAPTTIAINGGDNQTATAGQVLPVDPSVVVTDAGGNPVAGVTVTFAIASGGGSLTGATRTTNASGIATVGSWTLGCQAGVNTMTATSSGLSGSPLTFTATGTVGPAATLAINGGNNQTATAGTALPVSPSVKVTDACGNPVAGVSTTWTVIAGGGSTLGGNTVTDANGLATVGWVLGSTAGPNSLRVSSTGLSGSPVTFTATGTTGNANNIAVNGGNGQTEAVDAVLPTDPSVRVTDASGNPVAGIEVTFAITGGGGSLTGAVDTTGANGIAQVGSWRLGTVAGPNTMTATAPGLNGSPVQFTATAVPGAPNAGQTTATVPSGTVGAQTTITIQARDQFGNNRITGGGTVTVAVTGANTASAVVVDNGNGSYTATYTPQIGGNDVVTIRLNGTQIQGSPYNSSVSKAPTTTTITSDTPDPSTPGQAVDVAFTVTSANGTPTGTVTVTDGVDSCNASVSVGSCTITLTTVGTRTLVATYGGDAGFNGSTSAGASHQVNAAATTTTITNLNPNPSTVGQAVTVSFSVAGGSTTPTGSVTVSDGGSNSCNATLSAGSGSCAITFNSAGAFTLTAAYAGDGGHSGSTSAGVNQQVNPASTTTTITGHTPNPSGIGQAVAVSWTVTSSGGTPTGNVTVGDGTDSCTGTVASGGCNLTLNTSGARTLTAEYAGDGNFSPSTSPGVSHTVNLTGTTTTITNLNPNPSTVGQAVTVSFSVSGGATPTGTVTVSDGGSNSCNATLSGGSGSCAITFNSAGTFALTAVYGGDATHSGSSSAGMNQQVDPASTTTTITGHTPNPSGVGQAVAVTWTVTSSGGTPTGNVTVGDGTDSCTGTVASGGCSLTLNTSGGRTLTAAYAGDANFSPSTSPGVSHTVSLTGTTTTITSLSPNPSTVGQAVTVSFSVSGGATPTGTVTVSDGGSNSCNGSLTGGSGSCTITFNSAGTFTLTADYGGDASHSGSQSAGVNQQVDPASTTTTITSDNPDPSVVGETVTVAFTVTSAGGTPTGTVTVTDGTDSCNATVAAGSCSLALTTSGPRTLTATYSGDANFSGSMSPGAAHQVDPFGAVDPAQSTATVPAGTAGNVTTITIQARDSFGNAVGVGGASVVVTISGANSDTAVVTDNGDGTYTATYTPVNPGSDTVDITINGQPIQGNPFSSTVS